MIGVKFYNKNFENYTTKLAEKEKHDSVFFSSKIPVNLYVFNDFATNPPKTDCPNYLTVKTYDNRADKNSIIFKLPKYLQNELNIHDPYKFASILKNRPLLISYTIAVANKGLEILIKSIKIKNTNPSNFDMCIFLEKGKETTFSRGYTQTGIQGETIFEAYVKSLSGNGFHWNIHKIVIVKNLSKLNSMYYHGRKEIREERLLNFSKEEL